jgi:hypothetical protein
MKKKPRKCEEKTLCPEMPRRRAKAERQERGVAEDSQGFPWSFFSARYHGDPWHHQGPAMNPVLSSPEGQRK